MTPNRDRDQLRALRPDIVLDWPDHPRLLLEQAPDDQDEAPAVAVPQ